MLVITRGQPIGKNFEGFSKEIFVPGVLQPTEEAHDVGIDAPSSRPVPGTIKVGNSASGDDYITALTIETL